MFHEVSLGFRGFEKTGFNICKIQLFNIKLLINLIYENNNYLI